MVLMALPLFSVPVVTGLMFEFLAGRWLQSLAMLAVGNPPFYLPCLETQRREVVVCLLR